MIAFYKLMFNGCRPREAIERYAGPDYVQHNPHVPTGKTGFIDYFLVVWDFIHWAREHGIPVGPGRGSGAGSLVAWALGITDLDPLRYDLLFERFLNPERVSMPDFDVDFCMEGRDRVIDYVAQRYGRERVSQIITYGTMAAKAVVPKNGIGMAFWMAGEPGSADMVKEKAPSARAPGISRLGISALRNRAAATG